MAGLALFLFLSLFIWGKQYFGWDDPRGYVQIALFCSFLFGTICGFRVKD